jgi:predicted acylesterase/phospholipase RssA
MDNKFFPVNPLGKIALSLSGGGYRATAFHLGSMSYLNRTKFRGKSLLLNVEMISTVSGGSITGVVYALMIAEGKNFKDVYSFLLKTLAKEDLVEQAILMLNSEFNWNNEFKTKNLINAFSVLYDQKFTKGKVINDLDTISTHLKSFVFNSTEFNNGINFRFKKPGGNDYSGNFYNKIPDPVLPFIKLGDIIAASACFPGGFEPILWPGDFIYKGGEILNNVRTANPDDTGLMDGGIYDNQGIESILNYKKNELPYFDLIIISDVASPFMKPYKAVTESPDQKRIHKYTIAGAMKANKVINITLLSLLILFTCLPLFFNYANNILTGLCLALTSIVVIAIVLKAVIVIKITKKIDSLKDRLYSKMPTLNDEKLNNLKIQDIPFGRLTSLLLNRLNSLVVLFIDVFLKIVRRSNYEKLYTDDRYTFRRISNLVKELTEQDFSMRRNREGEINKASDNPNSQLTNNYQQTVGPVIQKITEEASSFATTLWFTEKDTSDDMLMKLVATGQVTMCYNLIKYLEKLIYHKDSEFSKLPLKVQTELQDLLKYCVKDWLKFKCYPMIMTNNLQFVH